MTNLSRSETALRYGSHIGRKAVAALHAELALYPKPGLVSPLDSGAHYDMDAGTFLRSLFALRHYFRAIADAGARDEPFAILQRLGVAAEARMLAATENINTHRGAIFCIGLLAAAAGLRLANGLDLSPSHLAQTVANRWGDAIAAMCRTHSTSHGSLAVAQYQVRGAREEARDGFPTLMSVAVPTLASALGTLGCPKRAQVQTLFAIMAELDDTNLLHRGGIEGLNFVRDQAKNFLARGGVASAGWESRAIAMHQQLIARRLSPGGSADMLAAAIFIQNLQT
jgi:triphosphoribosyl-dephospho-CoA synthase